jgi:AcrR family transcriptional regulator
VVRPSKAGRSSNATRQVRDAEATQNQILDAAEEEFAKHGLIATRTEAIAAQTGVTKAMIYYYFKSKEGLYQAVLERAFSGLLQMSQQLDLDQLPPEEALEKSVREFLACEARNPNLSRILFHEAIQNQGEYYKSTGFPTLFRSLIVILDRGIAQGCFRPLDPLLTAINIVGTCVFYFMAHENLKHLCPDKQMLSSDMIEQHRQEAIALIMAGVTGQVNSRSQSE